MIIQQTGSVANAGLPVEQQNVAPPVKQDVSVPQGQTQAPPVPQGQSNGQASQQRTNTKQLQDAVEQANKMISSLSKEVQFTVDKETGKELVKVVDRKTNEVIRQIPSEEMLAIAKRLDELQGLIIRQKA